MPPRPHTLWGPIGSALAVTVKAMHLHTLCAGQGEVRCCGARQQGCLWQVSYWGNTPNMDKVRMPYARPLPPAASVSVPHHTRQCLQHVAVTLCMRGAANAGRTEAMQGGDVCTNELA
jgi:hypothetical protein